jgi:hypothetical protein
LVDFFNILYGLIANGALHERGIDAFGAENEVHTWKDNHVAFIGETYTAVLYTFSLLFDPKKCVDTFALDSIEFLLAVVLFLYVNS